MLPEFDPRWRWLPDESGIFVNIKWEDDKISEYPPGLYALSPDGEDVFRIAPWESGQGIDPTSDYMVMNYDVSPDGNKIAFIMDKINIWGWDVGIDITNTQLWVAGRDGSSLILLDSYEPMQSKMWFEDVLWSPSGEYLAYYVYNGNSDTYELWIIKSDGSGKLRADVFSRQYYIEFSTIRWSPDSKKIAYAAEYYPDQQGFLDVWTVDISGNKNKLITANGIPQRFLFLEWFNDQRIILSGGYSPEDRHLWLIDAADAGNHILLSDNSNSESALSPDNKSLAFTQYDDNRWTIKISDDKGENYTLYDSPLNGWHFKPSDLRWSNNGMKLAFIDHAYEKIDDCSYKGYLVVIDLKTNEKKAFKVSDNEDACPSSYHIYTTTGEDILQTIVSKDTIAANAYGATIDVIWEGLPAGSSIALVMNANEESLRATQQAAYTQIRAYYNGENSLLWLSDNITFVAHDNNGFFAINIENGDKTYLPIGGWYIVSSPLGNYITYRKPSEPSSGCYGRNYRDLWAMSSLLNLTADLRVFKEKSAVTLNGIAADLNFGGYKLEYADVNNPDVWSLISHPSNVPVINDVFTTWVPPNEGTFYVKLTVWDKAGNVAVSRKRVSWGLSSSITNLYKNHDIFSPNGDGVKDTVELHYTVLEQVHLEFNIYDENNNLITTIQKDYSSPMDDYITWDGRDSSGKMVPDGKYKIKVFTYEFFLEVDNTPPDVGIKLKGLLKGGGTVNHYAELEGHALDTNIKNWIVEYGSDENPQEWNVLISGRDILVKRDENGKMLLNPVKDDLIERFFNDPTSKNVQNLKEDHIEWLVNKKFRITSEDFSGNKNSQITDFLLEDLLLVRIDDVTVDFREILTPIGGPGLHTFYVRETIRERIASITVQYIKNKVWYDGANVTYPVSGAIEIPWDSSHLDPNYAYSVRVKAIDIGGKEYYSNEVLLANEFKIVVNCEEKYAYNFFEDLVLLKFQFSGQDSAFETWTDYQIYDSERGDSVPEGKFTPPLFPLPSIKLGMTYKLRMVGVDVSGKEYRSNEVQYPPNCPVTLSLAVNYKEALSCGLISDKADLGAGFTSAGIHDISFNPASVSLKYLTYYLITSNGLQLLRQFDLATEEWGSVTIDTFTMPEGSYSVKAVLTYVDLNSNTTKEIPAANTLFIDRVLPTASITYPGKSLMICPITVSDPRGNWFGIPVEGMAIDNTNVRRYEMYYGFGSTPATWESAATRQNGKPVSLSVNGPKKGQLGIWDVTKLKGTAFSLKLKVVDVAGNVSCETTSFSVDDIIEMTSLTTDKSLFSSNGDEDFDGMKISYEINEYARVDVKVFKLIKAVDESYVLDSMPLRTLISGQQHLSGTENTSWDGKDDSGTVITDGLYAIAVFAADSCGNTNMRWIKVEVDNTPPTTIITYPRPPDPVGNMVEVKGTADDLHFQSYTLEAGQGDNPDTWVTILSSTTPVKDGIPGAWNTFGLDGRWTLRLTAMDTAGNKNTTTVTIDLGVRKNLIKDLSAAPGLFSPNNDRKLDTTNINYTLTDICQVKIDILDSADAVKKTCTTSASAGTYAYAWDGKDNSGAIVPDGAYTVKLTATLSSNPSVTQDETITIIVDITLPTVDIKVPVNNSYLKSDVIVNGSIIDQNLLEYSISYSGDAGTVLYDKANQNRENYTFGIISDLPEGSYILSVRAKDPGENTAEKNIAFVIDRMPPKVTLDTPKEGEFYGSGKNIITITGSIIEKNLDLFSVKYGSGDNPAQWTELLTGNTIPANLQLFTWRAGKNDGIADGLYTISFYAKDKAGLTGEAKVKITIDNTVPEVLITSPQDRGYVKAPIDIKGTAYDLNLDKYTVELSEGQCNSAFKWEVMKTSTTSIKDGVISSWQGLPSDGYYCLRLTAIDKLGNRGEAKVNVKVDTHPPATPVFSGKIENKSNVSLNWTQNTEPDFSGYDLYMDGRKINITLIKDINYLDQNLKEGIYTYTVKAIDLAGNESKPSNEVKLKVDITGPDANIRSPQYGSIVSGLINIKGTAYSADDFRQYRVYIAEGQNPTTWNLIRTSPVPTSYGTLVQWDTLGLKGLYSIKVEAEDLTGNINTHQIVVTVDDTPPAAPALIPAVPNGSNVTLTWKANTEPDLAGYLLYRNGQPTNASGIVIGDLKPYLITGTIYLDNALPDGRYKYYLIAMDQAGNLSDQSNTIEVNIDIRPPHATIVEPQDRSKFQNKTLIKAESPDLDIASIQFQYKKVQDTAWVTLGNPITQMPYITYIDPAVLGLTYGDYHIRAVATDKEDKTEPAPAFITVTYTDLTAPDTPEDLKARTNSKDATLTWTANTEADLNGYNIYRASENIKTKINTTIVKETTYQDKDISDGLYSYEITAADAQGNESKPSNSVSAKVYAPSVAQPYTPAGQKIISIDGSKAEANSTVGIFNETVTGSSSAGIVNADSQGNFTFARLNLPLGENRITAKATDSSGNISRASDIAVVVYNEPPSAPTGLVAPVNAYNVNLTWNLNTEPDLSGYNLYRDDDKINVPIAITSGNITASSDRSSYYSPTKAFDGNPSTYWMPYYSYGTFNPAWWEIALPSPELIKHIEVHWESELCAGKDYEIQVWSGYAWITQTKVTGNTEKDNTFDFIPSYRTDKIRIYVTDTTDPNSLKYVSISEVKILRDNLITQISYNDLNLHDGTYIYKVTAVDYYGFESLQSDEVKTVVGDVVHPSAPQNFTATASGSNVILNWSSNAETDLAGYNIYRGSSQGWLKINISLIAGNTYTDSNLLNGTYAYRITAVDTAGNESLPSNEASVTISIAPLQPPINLRVSSVPEGMALSISWERTGGPVAGYNLYRSPEKGGPYAKVNHILLNNALYLDTGLTNGVACYYVATAADGIGNESAYSSEAMGIPSDTSSPSGPEIFFPTISGVPVILYKDKTDISGFAEPGSVVELFRNSISDSRTSAFDKDTIQSFSVGSDIFEVSISPDGKTLAYSNDGSILLKTLSTGNVTKIIQKGNSPLWSPEGSKLSYIFMDSNWDSRIGIYDIKTGSSTPLTKDTAEDTDDEINPSWSSDGSKVAFIINGDGSQNVWIKDLMSGSLTQVTNNIHALNPKLSPDGTRLAFFEYPNLYLIDLLNGNTTMVDTQTDGYPIDWSPDSKELVFISYRNSNADIFILNVTSMNQNQITDSTSKEFNPRWSPDGKNILFEKFDAGRSASIWVTSINGQGRVLQQNLNNLVYLSWTKSGVIAALDQDILNIIYPEGHFSFKDIKLDPGENLFTAASTDSSGNVSPSSDEITVAFDTSLMPDMEITTDDIFVYPPYPIIGGQVSINVVVRNKGQVGVRDVGMDVYLMNPSGNIQLLNSSKISYIVPGSEEFVSINWNSSGKSGTNTVIAVVDPEDKIHELSETNNLAMKEIAVVSSEGILMTTTLDSDKYQINQDVKIHINLKNSGIEKDVTIETVIEDENKTIVASLNSINTLLPYAFQKDLNLVWNTGTAYAGSYKVHNVLKDGANVITENTVPFAILPDINIDSSVVTNKTAYGAKEDVVIDVNIKNKGENYVIPELKVKVRIVDAGNTEIFAEDKGITNLLPGRTTALHSTWNTGLNPLGDYSATVEIYIGDKFVSSKSISFEIDASMIITGSLTVTPTVVLIGNTIQVDYVMQNTGNTTISDLAANILIVDQETQTTMTAYADSIDLSVNATKNGKFTFPTQGYALKTYMAVLQYIYQGSTKTITTTTFTVKDGTPPVVSIISPVSGNYYNSKFDIVVNAVDNASDVDRVEYRIDNGAWKILPVSDLSTGRYASTWTPMRADEGVYTISLRATDKAGNTSFPILTIVTVDLTSPEPPVVISPPDSSFAPSGTVNIDGIAEPASIVEMAFNTTKVTIQADMTTGGFRFNGVKLTPGKNIFSFTAKDKAKNISEPAGYTLYLDISEWVTGTIKAQPNPVCQGKDVTLTYTVTNNGNDDINNLSVKVLIINPDTQEVKNSFEGTVNLPKTITATGSFTASTLSLAPGTYSAVLEVSTTLMTAQRTIANTTFEVKPAIEITKTIPDVINLLVWVNDKCNEHEEDNSEHCDYGKDKDKDRDEVKRCIRPHLLERILKEAATSYYIVYDKKDFEKELRNPYYTNILIIGDHHPLEDHFKEELREKVYSGTGIISSLWLQHGKDKGEEEVEDFIFGVRHKGSISGDSHVITTAKSPVTIQGIINAKGEAEKVEAVNGTTVAGWIKAKKDKYDHCGKGNKTYPGIVLNTYGRGKTVYYAFDLGSTLEEKNYNQLSTIMKNSISYIHKPIDITDFHPNQLIPVKIELKSLGDAFNLRITEKYSPEFKPYDIATGRWITDNPWVINMRLEPDETKTILYYALAPDETGTYTIQTEAGCMNNGTYTFYQKLNTEIVIDKDSISMTNEIIKELQALSVSKQDKSKLNNAIKYMVNIQKRVIVNDEGIKKNIHDIVRAINSLLSLSSIDVSGIRFIMDSLLRVWEARWYEMLSSLQKSIMDQ